MNRLWFYQTLMRIRPCQIAAFIKVIFRISRRPVKSSSDTQYWIDPVSNLGLHLLTTGTYEPTLTALLKAVLRPGDVFIDIGANEGYFSTLAGQIVGSGGVVHAIEPQCRLHEIILKNAALNSLDNVVLHREALSIKEGIADLYLRPDTNSGASSFYRHWRLGSHRVAVHTTTLDALTDKLNIKHVRLIKIDCEGAERDVLGGGSRFLTPTNCDILVLEFHPLIIGADACQRLHAQLSKSGFTLTRVHGLTVYHAKGSEEMLSLLTL